MASIKYKVRGAKVPSDINIYVWILGPMEKIYKYNIRSQADVTIGEKVARARVDDDKSIG